MDPMAEHRTRQDAMPDKMKALRDSQMGRGGSEPGQPCANCGQRHTVADCPHAMGKQAAPVV